MWNDFIELTEDLDNICRAHCGEPEERGPWHPNHINKFYRSVTCELAHTSVGLELGRADLCPLQLDNHAAGHRPIPPPTGNSAR